MKKLVCSFGFVGLFISCSEPADETAAEPIDTTTQVVVPEIVEPEIINSFVLESGTVGLFKIGAPMPKLPTEISSRKATATLTEDGKKVDHVMYVISNSLEDIAEVIMVNDTTIAEEDLTIQEVVVISNYYETSNNVKIGTTLTTFAEKHPDTKVWYNGATGELVAETSAYPEIQFILDPDSSSKKPKGTKNINLSLSSFNEDTKIKTIKVL